VVQRGVTTNKQVGMSWIIWSQWSSSVCRNRTTRHGMPTGQ